jgi:aspartokinase
VVPYLTYVEASEMMREERIKVVHYKVLNPLIMGDIRFHIKDILNPESPGTVIGPEDGNHDEAWYGRPKAITFQRKLSGLRFLPTQSRTPTEVYAKVFAALAEEKVDVRYISISGFQISLLMPESDLEKAIQALDSLDVALDLSHRGLRDEGSEGSAEQGDRHHRRPRGQHRAGHPALRGEHNQVQRRRR